MIYLAFLVVGLLLYFPIAFFAKIWPFKPNFKTPDANILTDMGVRISVVGPITQRECDYVDEVYKWGSAHGLHLRPSDITIIFYGCEQTPGGNYGFKDTFSPTGWAGAHVISLNPTTIGVCRQDLSHLYHEFWHVVLHYRNGNSDPLHNDDSWSEMNLFNPKAI